MKKRETILLIIILLLGLTTVGCSSDGPIKDVNESELAETLDESLVEKISVVATLYPQYDFARIIGGEYADVKYLLPTGSEAHSYEPTPQDMVSLLSADVFLYTGQLMEPWTANIVSNLKDEDVMVVDLSSDITMMTAEDPDHDHEDDEDADHGEEVYDPHFWTDPNMAMIMVDTIANALSEADSANGAYYVENAKVLKGELQKLDQDIRDAMSKTTSKTILSGGHFAFGYFARQYGLEHMSPYVGFSPNAEPTPQRITALIHTINETGAKAIFHEELIDPKVAQVIVDETGIKMLLLHGVHNISREDLEAGKTYVDIMYENLENLKEGLGYEG